MGKVFIEISKYNSVHITESLKENGLCEDTNKMVLRSILALNAKIKLSEMDMSWHHSVQNAPLAAKLEVEKLSELLQQQVVSNAKAQFRSDFSVRV